MMVSLNEVESTVLKAARGAGLAWGLAEEAAAAARVLAAWKIAWAPAVLDVLTSDFERSPLQLGARFADLAGSEEMSAALVAHPILLLPFAVTAAAASGRAISITIADDDGVTVDAAGLVSGDVERLALVALAPRVHLAMVEAASRPAPVPHAISGVEVDAATWRRFDALVALTYVPASEQSRLTGAGAGLADND